jgi:hypothetical protein
MGTFAGVVVLVANIVPPGAMAAADAVQSLRDNGGQPAASR